VVWAGKGLYKMAQGISVSLPLFYDKQDGPFKLNKTIQESVKQNFKNLILTNTGERIMDPLFGVGIYSYLFENYSQATQSIINAEVVSQVNKYLPFITIQQLLLNETSTNLNQFYIYIKYSINSLDVLDELSFVVTR
jgi:phage baseplate assembly protein W